MQDTFENFQKTPFVYKNQYIEIKIFMDRIIVDRKYEFRIDASKYKHIIETLIQIQYSISNFKTGTFECTINKKGSKIVCSIDSNMMQLFRTSYGTMAISPFSCNVTLDALVTLISYGRQMIFINEMRDMFEYHPDNEIAQNLSIDFKSRISV